VAFPTFVGHGGAVQETTTTLTVVNSASAANGDYELLVIETMNEAVTLTTTGGFTAVPFDDGSGNGIWPNPNATATIASRLTVFERIFNSQADPITDDPGNHVIANIFTFRKSSGTWSTLDDVRSPTEGTGWKATIQSTETTSASMDGITTDTVDQLIVGITAAAKPDVAGGTTEMGTVTNTNLASITERHDDAAASGNGGWIGVWTGQEATSGQAIGASTYTKTAASFMEHLVIGIRDAAPAGAQGVTAGLVSQTAATFSPTITPGAVSVVVGLINSLAAVFSPTLAQVTNVTPGLISNLAVASTPTITPGSVTVTVGLISSLAATLSPAITQPGVFTGLISQTGATFSPTIVPGSVSIAPPLINALAATLTPNVELQLDTSGGFDLRWIAHFRRR
jgi:hypothetical protein